MKPATPAVRCRHLPEHCLSSMKIRPVLLLTGVVALVASLGCQSLTPAARKPSRAAVPAASPLVWQNSPGQPTYYINSVAISGDGGSVVGGTFLHTYGESPAHAGAAQAGDSQTGTFGTYAYDRTGKMLWKDEFNGWQGTYWVDLCASGAFAAS